MNELLSLLIFAIPLLGAAMNSHDAYWITASLIDRYATSNEWADDIDSMNEDVDMEFTSPLSLFVCDISTNAYAGFFSSAERQRAFDLFLLEIPNMNPTNISRRCEADARYALVYCAETGYKNGLCAATNILSRAESPFRPIAFDVMRKLLLPSFEANNYVYTILTNQTFELQDRNDLFNDYALRLMNNEEIDECVVTNGIAMLWRALPQTSARRRIDDLLVAKIPLYVVSSNRLTYAQEVLGMDSLSPQLKNYFSAVTNQLINAKQPLPAVRDLREL